MKKSDIYDAVSGIDEKYCRESEDFEGIAAEFKRAGIRKLEKMISLAASFVIVIALGVYFHNNHDLLDPSSFIEPSYTDESGSVSIETTQAAVTMPAISDGQPSSSEAATMTSTDGPKGTTAAVTHTKMTASMPDFKFPVTTPEAAPAVTIPVTTVKPENTVTKPNAAITTAKPVVTFPVTTQKPVNTTVSHVGSVSGTVTETPDITATTVSSTIQPEPSEPPETTSTADVMPEPPTVTTTTEHPDDGSQDPPGGGSHEPPDDGLNISQEYAACVFNGGYYKTLNVTADTNMIGEYLGVADMLGYDPYTDTNCQCQAFVYKIIGIPESEKLAVLFQDEKKYFIYCQY